MNERSSRSHMIVSVTVTSRLLTSPASDPAVAKMYLVDLAGSERIHALDKVPDRLRESQVRMLCVRACVRACACEACVRACPRLRRRCSRANTGAGDTEHQPVAVGAG
jgi:hypothetical protein